MDPDFQDLYLYSIPSGINLELFAIVLLETAEMFSSPRVRNRCKTFNSFEKGVRKRFNGHLSQYVNVHQG